MDDLMLRITEAAQQLARDRQAVSAQTAADLVVQMASIEGVAGLQQDQIVVLAEELCELIEKYWTAPNGASRS